MTPEQMSWEGDEELYQPRIHSRRIRDLHQISKETGDPMTVLLDRALGDFVVRYREAGHAELQAAFVQPSATDNLFEEDSSPLLSRQ
jgi:hypothetical protein